MRCLICTFERFGVSNMLLYHFTVCQSFSNRFFSYKYEKIIGNCPMCLQRA